MCPAMARAAQGVGHPAAGMMRRDGRDALQTRPRKQLEQFIVERLGLRIQHITQHACCARHRTIARTAARSPQPTARGTDSDPMSPIVLSGKLFTCESVDQQHRVPCPR